MDFPSDYPDSSISEAAKRQFEEHFLHPLGDDVRYVQLESGFRVKCPGYKLTPHWYSTEMHKHDSHCNDLIEKTAAALTDDTVALMLLAVQNSNLELSVKVALNR